MKHEQTWDVLEAAVNDIQYVRDLPPSRQRFRLDRDDDGNYAVLYIYTYNPNLYRPGEMRHTRHEFVVPIATYNRPTWIRWVFDRILSIERHETCESFLVDGERVYAPHHGNGEDPYVVWYTREDRAAQVAKAPGED